MKNIENDPNLQNAALIVIKEKYTHSGIIKCLTEYLKSLGYKENCSNDQEINENCVEVLKDAGLLESSQIHRASKPHWLHDKILQNYDDENISSSPLYKMLEMYPAGSMV